MNVVFRVGDWICRTVWQRPPNVVECMSLKDPLSFLSIFSEPELSTKMPGGGGDGVFVSSRMR